MRTARKVWERGCAREHSEKLRARQCPRTINKGMATCAGVHPHRRAAAWLGRCTAFAWGVPYRGMLRPGPAAHTIRQWDQKELVARCCDWPEDTSTEPFKRGVKGEAS